MRSRTLADAGQAESVYVDGPQHRRRVSLHHRPQVRQEVPRQHAGAARAAAESVGRSHHGNGQAGSAAGERFRAGRREAAAGAERPWRRRAAAASPARPISPISISWREVSAVLLNLLPDKKGMVEIPREALGTHQHLHVVAVDPLNTAYRSVSLPEEPSRIRRPAAGQGARSAKRISRSRSRSRSSTAGSRSCWPTSPVRGSKSTTAWPACTRLYATLSRRSETGRVQLHHSPGRS